MLTTLMQERKLAVERTLSTTAQRFEVRSWDDTEQKLLSTPALPAIEWDRGELFVAGRPMLNAHLDGNVVTWLQIATDHFCSGLLQFSADRLSFMGSVCIGRDEASAESLAVAGVVPPSVYRSRVAASGYIDAQTVPAFDPANNGVSVTLGYRFSEFDHAVELFFSLDTVDCVEEGIVGLTRDSAGNLQATINPHEAARYSDANPQWPAAGVLTFSWDALTLQGWLRKYDSASESGVSSQKFEWKGDLDESESPHLLQAPPARFAVSSVTLRNAAALTLAELQSLHPEGLDAILNDQLQENMKWAMDDNLRVTFFGQVKPDFSPTRINLVKQDEAFYRDKFAVAYLSSGLNMSEGAARPSQPFDAKEKRRLTYYLHNGLAAEAGYNRQSNATFRTAFVTAIPRLSDYIASDSKGWAKKLYDHLLLPRNINLVVGQVTASATMETPQRYCNLLWALSPESDYSVTYYNKVLSGVLGAALDDVKFEENSEDHISLWLEDWIRKFIELNIGKPVTDAQAEMARWRLAVDLNEAITKAGNAAQVARAMAQAMIIAAPGRDLWEKTIRAERWLVDKQPVWGKIAGRALRLTTLAYGVYALVGSFQGWETMNTRQKISLITETVSLTRNLIMQVPGIISEVLDIKAWNDVRRAMKGPNAPVVAAMEAAAVGGEAWIHPAARATKSWLKDAKEAKNSVGRFFKNVGRLVQLAGVAVSAVFTAVAVWTLVDQIRNGGSVTDLVMNGIIAAASLVETACVTLALFITSSTLTAIGGVFAVIGLVFAMVQMFRPRETPPSPVDEFMNGKAREFIRSVPDPPAEWKEPGLQLLTAAAIA